MKMKLLTLTGMMVILACSSLSAQKENAIGLRGGWFGGVTFQHQLSSSTTLELIAQGRNSWFNITGLYEIHKDFSDVDGMKWYYGAGGHIGFYNYSENHPVFRDRYTGNATFVGADGILGLEYFFSELPLQVSVDYKPMFNLGGGGIWWYNDAGLAIRYVF
jgi:hypothetical protein